MTTFGGGGATGGLALALAAAGAERGACGARAAGGLGSDGIGGTSEEFLRKS